MQAKWFEKPCHFYSYKEFILSNLRFIYLDQTLERPLNKVKLIHFQKASRLILNATEDVNVTLVDCSVVIVENSLLSQNQRIILTVFNTLLMLENIIANSFSFIHFDQNKTNEKHHVVTDFRHQCFRNDAGNIWSKLIYRFSF